MPWFEVYQGNCNFYSSSIINFSFSFFSYWFCDQSKGNYSYAENKLLKNFILYFVKELLDVSQSFFNSRELSLSHINNLEETVVWLIWSLATITMLSDCLSFALAFLLRLLFLTKTKIIYYCGLAAECVEYFISELKKTRCERQERIMPEVSGCEKRKYQWKKGKNSVCWDVRTPENHCSATVPR